MIGNTYWSTGILVRHDNGKWHATVEYFDNGFVDDNADDRRVSTEGKLHTRYYLRDGKHADALTIAIDTVKADAERLGITWRDVWATEAKATIYMDDEETAPAGWRELANAQARRLGWEPCYSERTT